MSQLTSYEIKKLIEIVSEWEELKQRVQILEDKQEAQRAVDKYEKR